MIQGQVWSGSRRLLKNLREVMAAPATAQARLDRIAMLIAADMVAEVCSIYMRRAGDVLELFATEGLKLEAVHNTRLRVGEGLVGLIAAQARPVALADAQTHPGFVYRPETGEEVYHSLMGVPILSAGRVIGVLVVQNRTRRQYDDEEVETLQTIAMVLAELVTGGELIKPEELRPADGLALLPLRLEGVGASGGIGMGDAVLHRPPIVVHRIVAEDPAEELDHFETALNGMHSALDALLEAPDMKGGGEHIDVLETYRMFAEDRGWLKRIRESIRGGLTAEAAVERVAGTMRARLGQAGDPLLRERLHDLDDLSNRLLQHLSGIGEAPPAKNLPDNAIVMARTMGPAELLDYERGCLRALVLEESSPTAHVAIVARALNIPVVTRVEGLLEQIEAGDPIIVDGDHAQIFVRPGERVREVFDASLVAQQRRRASFAAIRDAPATTQDGVEISLQMNAGLLMDMQALHECGASGVGLYRTEIPFMVRAAFPDVDDQAQFYARVLELADGKPVTFRTLDVGGDKALPYLERPADENPAMGWRAIRIGLDRPAMLRQQLRALIRAAGGGELSVMFPMISEVAEFEAARHLLDIELERARSRGIEPPSRQRIGVMLEVPALIWQLPTLLPRIDFLSVGSNDLLQFMFASDRGNPRLAERYDPLSPPVLALLRSIAEQCDAQDVPVTVCGEIAGQPLEAMALVGLGFRSFSMAPPAVGPLKAMIRSLTVASLGSYVRRLESLPDHSVREMLRSFALDHGIST